MIIYFWSINAVMTYFGGETLTIKTKFWVPPPGIEPVSYQDDIIIQLFLVILAWFEKYV